MEGRGGQDCEEADVFLVFYSTQDLGMGPHSSLQFLPSGLLCPDEAEQYLTLLFVSALPLPLHTAKSYVMQVVSYQQR